MPDASASLDYRQRQLLTWAKGEDWFSAARAASHIGYPDAELAEREMRPLVTAGYLYKSNARNEYSITEPGRLL